MNDQLLDKLQNLMINIITLKPILIVDFFQFLVLLLPITLFIFHNNFHMFNGHYQNSNKYLAESGASWPVPKKTRPRQIINE